MCAVDSRVEDLLRTLHGANTVAPQWAVIRDWAEARDVERLRETAFALNAASLPGVPGWAVASVFDYLVKQLALTPSAEFASVLRDVARQRDARDLASLVAAGQPFDVVSALVAAAEPPDDEFCACLAQELVLRVERLDREPFASYWERVSEHGHPLGWLPLRLTDVEESVMLPQYSERGMAVGLPFGPPEGRRQTDAALVPLLREITSPPDREVIATAVSDWLEDSNGRAEAGVYALAAGSAIAPLTNALADAGLQCLAGASAAWSQETTHSEAFETLFSAASTGGAYSHGRRGAYGRLEAWKTLAGLAGIEPDQPFEHVHAAALQATWFRFGAENDWFYGVAWDFGLAAMQQDARTLAVLVATDTD